MVELYAAVSEQPLAAAIAEMRLDASLTAEPAELAAYQRERSEASSRLALWRIAQERVRTGLTSATRGIFQDLRIHYSDNALTGLSGVVGVLRREDFDRFDVPHESRWALTDLGNHNALALPVWCGATLVGFWLLSPQRFTNGFALLDLLGGTSLDHSLSNGNRISLQQRHTIVTNDPRVALRFMARQVTDDQYIHTVVTVPVGRHDPADVFSHQRRVMLPCPVPGDDGARWARRALAASIDVADVDDLGYHPLAPWPERLSSRRALEQMTIMARPAAAHYGRLLLSCSEQEAGRIALEAELSATERSAIRGQFDGDDANFLQRVFERCPLTRWIEYDGQTIVEDKTGWSVKGKTISSAVIRVTSAITDRDTNQTMMTGTVAFDNKLVPFHEDKSVINRNARVWLDALVARNGGWLTASDTWGRKLLNIAMAFSLAEQGGNIISVGTQRFGWDSRGVLHFNRFNVDAKGPIRCAEQVGGPDMPFPESLTPVEWESFGSNELCMVALALLGNLVRTRHGQAGHGIVLPSARHVVTRLAESFCMPVVDNPSVEAVRSHAHSPLPLPGYWASEHLGELVRRREPNHILTSVDGLTFELMATEPAWLRLPVDNLPDYESLRAIFYLLPLVIDLKPSSSGFYSALVKRIAQFVTEQCSHHSFAKAGSQLDYHWAHNEQTSATNTLRLLRRLAEQGKLKIEKVEDGILIAHADVRAVLSSPVLPPPVIAQLSDLLQRAGMLLRSTPTHWTVKPDLWDLVHAYQL